VAGTTWLKLYVPSLDEMVARCVPPASSIIEILVSPTAFPEASSTEPRRPPR
jgi:hypothetical protein